MVVANGGRVVGEVVVDGDASRGSPRTSMRRFTPWKRDSAAMPAASGTPAWRAAASAASAFVRLCSPRRVPAHHALRDPVEQHLEGVVRRSAVRRSRRGRARSARRGVQQPLASTRAIAASAPLATSSPLAGNACAPGDGTASRSPPGRRKMSAWSNSRLFSITVRGRYWTNLERLSKKAVSYSSASTTKKGESVEPARRRRSPAAPRRSGSRD